MPPNVVRRRARAPSTVGEEASEFFLNVGRAVLDAVVAPIDVLPVSSSLHRVPGAAGPPAGDDNALKSRSMPNMGQLLKDHAGSVKALPSSKQVVLLVFFFVVLDVSKSLAVSWAAVHGQMCAPLAICAKNTLSIACGMLLATVLDGRAGLRQCLEIKRALKVLPIAGGFCGAQMFALQALRAFDPGSLKIMSQVNLPTTAALSWLVLGRRYSAQQWLATSLLLFATLAFLQVRVLFFEPPERRAGGERWQREPDKVIGMFHVLSSIALSCSSSILAERFLKRRREVPFYIQKTNLMLGELVSACVMVKLSLDSDSRRENGGIMDVCSSEQIHNWRQIPVVLVWFTHGWMAGLLVKRCSALVKNVSHILSATVTYFIPLLFMDNVEDFWPVTLSAWLVLMSVMVYATVPQSLSDRRSTKQSKDFASMRRRKSTEGVLTLQRARSEGQKLSEARQREMLQGGAPIASAPSVAKDGDMELGHVGQALLARTFSPSPPEPRWQDEPQSTKDPPQKAPRRSWHSIRFLVLSFILLDALKPVLITWAHQNKEPQERFINSTFVLVQTSLSLLVGLFIAVGPSVSLSPLRINLHPMWRQSLRCCLDKRAVAYQFPVSGCLCMSKLFLVMALERLDAGAVRVFGQASLPLVGVGSAVLFSKRYTAQQWCSLVAISLALVTFYYVKAQVQAEKTEPGRPFEVVGVMLVITAITFNCLGALLVEKFLKKTHGRVVEQKAQLLLGEVIINACLLVLMPLFGDLIGDHSQSPWERGFFAGWDRRVLTCAIIWIPAGWTATILVKRCSNVLKMIAQGAASVLTYVFSVVPLSRGPRAWGSFVKLLGPPLDPEPFSWPVVLLAITVMFAALTFGTDSDTRQQRLAEQARKALAQASQPEQRGKANREADVSNWRVDRSYQRLRDLQAAAGTERYADRREIGG